MLACPRKSTDKRRKEGRKEGRYVPAPEVGRAGTVRVQHAYVRFALLNRDDCSFVRHFALLGCILVPDKVELLKLNYAFL